MPKPTIDELVAQWLDVDIVSDGIVAKQMEIFSSNPRLEPRNKRRNLDTTTRGKQ